MSSTTMDRNGSWGLGTLGRSVAFGAVLLGLAGTFGCTSAPVGSSGASAAEPASNPLDEAAVREMRNDTRKVLGEHRQLQLGRLRAYADRGIFPQNDAVSPLPIHMFKDKLGHLCAIANLIHEDGLGALVDRAVREHNDVIVADEENGDLHDWVLVSGLTRDEVRRIQGAGFEGFPQLGQPDVRMAVRVDQLRTQTRLRDVLSDLAATTDVALDLATERLLAARGGDAKDSAVVALGEARKMEDGHPRETVLIPLPRGG